MNVDAIQKVRASFQNAINAGLGEHRELVTQFHELWPEIQEMLREGYPLSQISAIWKANGLESRELPVRMLIQMELMKKAKKTIDEVNELLGLAPLPAPPKGPCCLPLDSHVQPLTPRDSVDQHIYANGVMEHPAIPGLMLTMEERVYGAWLIYRDANGQLQKETGKQRLFRIKWKKPVPAWKP